jgi:hypothetical protein
MGLGIFLLGLANRGLFRYVGWVSLGNFGSKIGGQDRLYEHDFLKANTLGSGIRSHDLQSPRWQAETIPLDHAARARLSEHNF